MEWTDVLTSADLAFVKKFVLVSGNLKEISRLYDVSYPTVRAKLDKIIDKIQLEKDGISPFEMQLRGYAITNNISSHLIDEIVSIYENTREVV